MAIIAPEQTGIGSVILKKMLPMAATLAMGALGKKASGLDMLGAVLGGGSPQPSQLSGLSAFLDFDKDGSVADDILGIAKKLL